MHTHAPLSTRGGWKTHRERSLSKYLSIRPMQSSIRGPMHLQQIQIENREGKREIHYLQIQETGVPSLCHILNYNSQERPKSQQNYSLWQKQACNENKNININSIPRLDISWLKQHLTQVSPAYVGVLTIELLFLDVVWIIKPVITAQKLFICKTRPPGAQCKTFLSFCNWCNCSFCSKFLDRATAEVFWKLTILLPGKLKDELPTTKTRAKHCLLI